MSSETTNLHIPRPKRIREYLTKPSQRFDRYYHGSRLRLLLICAGAALVLFFICFLIVDDILMPRATRHGSEFALPDIVGSRVADAERLLAENQLRLQVT